MDWNLFLSHCFQKSSLYGLHWEPLHAWEYAALAFTVEEILGSGILTAPHSADVVTGSFSTWCSREAWDQPHLAAFLSHLLYLPGEPEMLLHLYYSYNSTACLNLISFLLTLPETQVRPFKLGSCCFLTLVKFSLVTDLDYYFCSVCFQIIFKNIN